MKLAIFGADHSENTVTIVKAMLTQHVLGYVLGTFRSRFGGVPKHRWLLGWPHMGIIRVYKSHTFPEAFQACLGLLKVSLAFYALPGILSFPQPFWPPLAFQEDVAGR